MKKIENWTKATVFDIEADGLLDEATKIHVLSYSMQSGNRGSLRGIQDDGYHKLRAFFTYHMKKGIPVVVHNGIGYDIPLVEKLLDIDLSSLMVIDTLALSWYLNFDRNQHGLGTFHEDYGIEKPVVDDWEGQPYEVYKHRCEEDVKINEALWEDLKLRLIDIYTLAQGQIDLGNVGGKRTSPDEVIYLDRFVGSSVEDSISRLLTFLMFKMDCARLKEKTRWKVDTKLLRDSLEELTTDFKNAKAELESVMPNIPKYAERKAPAEPFKKNGELSSSGKAWEEIKSLIKDKAISEKGHPMVVESAKDGYVKLLTGYKPPNANSPEQIKDFLYSKGWVPQTFKYVRDKEAFNQWVASKPREGSNRAVWSAWKAAKPVDRAVPQITVPGDNGKELCPSLTDLAEEVPEIAVYAKYCVIKHRLGVLNGFVRDMSEDGWLKARIAGFTNTLRQQHAEIVNLPGVDKPYGDIVRGVLIAESGNMLCGSDLSSLEDRTKIHFMIPHDPKYAEEISKDGYDPHISTALAAGLVTKDEFDRFMLGDKTDNAVKARRMGKTTVYASVYNASPPTIALAAGIDIDLAKTLFEGYWELNWSVKAIAEEQVVVTDSRGGKWLINPINGFCYSLRKESDRFSTLCQGTGSFFFDMWVDNILEEQQRRWGKKTLTADFHDENIFSIKDNQNAIEAFKEIIKNAIKKVNTDFMLRRELDCDVQVGKRYSEIH